jgi:hypothetical protein
MRYNRAGPSGFMIRRLLNLMTSAPRPATATKRGRWFRQYTGMKRRPDGESAMSPLKLVRMWGRVPWACLLGLVAPAALAAVLVVGYVRPGSFQVNQFPPTPSRWYAVPLPGVIQVYHFGATVPESTVPFFMRMNSGGGTWARGALVLGETRVSAALSASAVTGYVHQGGGPGRRRRSPAGRSACGGRSGCRGSCSCRPLRSHSGGTGNGSAAPRGCARDAATT